MSNNIRAATVTDDEAAARNSAARFAFFFFFSSPRSSSLTPRRVIAVCATPCLPREPLFTVPVSTDPRFHRIPNAFRPDDCYSYQPLSLIARPRASIVSMNSALNAVERDAVNRHWCEPRMRPRNLTSATILASGKRMIALVSFTFCFYFYVITLYIFKYY